MGQSWDTRMHFVGSPDEARPQTMALLDGQQYCNFVVLEPTKLPVGLRISDCSVRAEAPPGRPVGCEAGHPDWTESNRSSIRIELSSEHRQVRVKEFLYDWAPPAFDHPCLWKTKATPHVIGNDVAWCGVDFKGNPAAYLSLDRTSVELSVLAGDFLAPELIALLAGLRPVDSRARVEILATSFARLAYCARHKEPAIEVPTGFFRHQRSPMSSIDAHVREQIPKVGAVEQRMPNVLADCELDGAFVVVKDNSPVETDFVYEHPEVPGRTIRILVIQDRPSDDKVWPPVLDEQPCTMERYRPRKTQSTSECCHDHAVFLALTDRELGQFEAMFRKADRTIIVIAKPHRGMNMEKFCDLVDAVLVL